LPGLRWFNHAVCTRRSATSHLPTTRSIIVLSDGQPRIRLRRDHGRIKRADHNIGGPKGLVLYHFDAGRVHARRVLPERMLTPTQVAERLDDRIGPTRCCASSGRLADR
jgi:hypothetical protein